MTYVYLEDSGRNGDDGGYLPWLHLLRGDETPFVVGARTGCSERSGYLLEERS